MIWGRWVDPNFKFRARDKEGHPVEFFCYAESEEALGARLIEKGLEEIEIEPYDFSEWRARAETATQKAIAAHNAGQRLIKFNGKIWAELKWHLFELFHGKCAYCESMVQHVAYGDVEHYRPKSKVDEDPKRDDDPGHPGYYWLAYDVTNLLPSCGLCNQARGKMTHFPVVNQHARQPENLGQEQPLLLNPYNRDINPFEHLEFNENGEALPHKNSPYGESSKKYYHLNRSGIGEVRRNAISKVQRDWAALAGIYSSVMLGDARQQLWDDVMLGYREYSAAQVWELRRITEKGRV
jgi:hypothetical protein